MANKRGRWHFPHINKCEHIRSLPTLALQQTGMVTVVRLPSRFLNTPPQSDDRMSLYSMDSIPSIKQKRSCFIPMRDFVRMSAAMSFIPMSLSPTDLFAMHSHMKWYQTLMCLVTAWLTGFRARRSTARLSICKAVAPDAPSWSSDISLQSQISSLAASATVTYSAWVEDVAVDDCCFDIQETTPPE